MPNQVNGPTGTPGNEIPENHGEPDKDEERNYLLESEEDVSLRPEDFIVLEDLYEQEMFCRRLVSTARSIKRNNNSFRLIITGSMTSG